MEDIKEFSEDIQTGEQGPITKTVLEVSAKIPDDREKLIISITSYINSLEVVDSDVPDFTRNADQIIESGEQRGCHEAGLVFATLLRAKGVNVSYIQAFLKEDLKSYSSETGGNVGGHVFIRDHDKIIDSTSGEITEEIPQEYILGAEGLDSWDIGLKNGMNDYLNLFIKIKKENHFQL